MAENYTPQGHRHNISPRPSGCSTDPYSFYAQKSSPARSIADAYYNQGPEGHRHIISPGSSGCSTDPHFYKQAPPQSFAEHRYSSSNRGSVLSHSISEPSYKYKRSSSLNRGQDFYRSPSRGQDSFKSPPRSPVNGGRNDSISIENERLCHENQLLRRHLDVLQEHMKLKDCSQTERRESKTSNAIANFNQSSISPRCNYNTVSPKSILKDPANCPDDTESLISKRTYEYTRYSPSGTIKYRETSGEPAPFQGSRRDSSPPRERRNSSCSRLEDSPGFQEGSRRNSMSRSEEPPYYDKRRSSYGREEEPPEFYDGPRRGSYGRREDPRGSYDCPDEYDRPRDYERPREPSFGPAKSPVRKSFESALNDCLQSVSPRRLSRDERVSERPDGSHVHRITTHKETFVPYEDCGEEQDDLAGLFGDGCPSPRLLGEIAFQLDRRILSYIFNGPEVREKKRFYGFTIQNIGEMIVRESIDKCTGCLDHRLKMDLQYRHDCILEKLKCCCYSIAFHPNFTADMVNKYGLLPLPVDRSVVNKLTPAKKPQLEKLIHELSPPSDFGDMIVILDCLCMLAKEDCRPLIIC